MLKIWTNFEIFYMHTYIKNENFVCEKRKFFLFRNAEFLNYETLQNFRYAEKEKFWKCKKMETKKKPNIL